MDAEADSCGRGTIKDTSSLFFFSTQVFHMHPQKNNNLNTENCDTEDGWMSVVGTLERRL